MVRVRAVREPPLRVFEYIFEVATQRIFHKILSCPANMTLMSITVVPFGCLSMTIRRMAGISLRCARSATSASLGNLLTDRFNYMNTVGA